MSVCVLLFHLPLTVRLCSFDCVLFASLTVTESVIITVRLYFSV